MDHLRYAASVVATWGMFVSPDTFDQRKMFPIFRQHAKPRAALMFTSGPEHGKAIGEFAGERLYHASLSAVEYRSLLDTNGFDLIKYIVNDPDCGDPTACWRNYDWIAGTTQPL